MIKIDIFYFFISLFIGFFIVYITAPKPIVIVKYPTVKNAGKILYEDDNGVCYKYKALEVNCTNNNVILEEQEIPEENFN
jgi:hypothetical protein